MPADPKKEPIGREEAESIKYFLAEPNHTTATKPGTHSILFGRRSQTVTQLPQIPWASDFQVLDSVLKIRSSSIFKTS